MNKSFALISLVFLIHSHIHIQSMLNDENNEKEFLNADEINDLQEKIKICKTSSCEMNSIVVPLKILALDCVLYKTNNIIRQFTTETTMIEAANKYNEEVDTYIRDSFCPIDIDIIKMEFSDPYLFELQCNYRTIISVVTTKVPLLTNSEANKEYFLLKDMENAFKNRLIKAHGFPEERLTKDPWKKISFTQNNKPLPPLVLINTLTRNNYGDITVCVNPEEKEKTF